LGRGVEPPLVTELERIGGTSTCWIPLRAWICALMRAAAAAGIDMSANASESLQMDGASNTNQPRRQGQPEETWSRRACRGIAREGCVRGHRVGEPGESGTDDRNASDEAPVRSCRTSSALRYVSRRRPLRCSALTSRFDVGEWRERESADVRKTCGKEKDFLRDNTFITVRILRSWAVVPNAGCVDRVRIEKGKKKKKRQWVELSETRPSSSQLFGKVVEMHMRRIGFDNLKVLAQLPEGDRTVSDLRCCLVHTVSVWVHHSRSDSLPRFFLPAEFHNMIGLSFICHTHIPRSRSRPGQLGSWPGLELTV
jgi:hypothetical protein